MIYMSELSRLASNIELLMKRSGRDSQLKLAAASGVSQTQIGNILRAEKSPTISTLIKLAHGLRVSPWQVLAPPELLQRGMDKQFSDLLDCFLAADDQGRETLLTVARSLSRKLDNP